MHGSRSARALSLVTLVLVTLTAACGGDPATSSASSSTTSTIETGTADFCSAAGKLVAAIGSGAGDPSEALKTAINTAPKPLAKDLSTLGEKFGKAASSGDERAFLANDLREIANTTFAGIASACAYQIIDFSAVEYKFDGIPAVVNAGLTAFHMTDLGSEVHEMLLYRRAKGTEGNIVDIVNDDPTVSDGRLEAVSVMFPAAHGEESRLLVDLTSGDYVAVCFFPKGTMSMAQVGGQDRTGPDHRSLGMITPFAVK